MSRRQLRESIPAPLGSPSPRPPALPDRRRCFRRTGRRVSTRPEESGVERTRDETPTARPRRRHTERGEGGRSVYGRGAPGWGSCDNGVGPGSGHTLDRPRDRKPPNRFGRVSRSADGLVGTRTIQEEHRRSRPVGARRVQPTHDAPPGRSAHRAPAEAARPGPWVCCLPGRDHRLAGRRYRTARELRAPPQNNTRLVT